MNEFDLERHFIRICIENQWCDDHYAQKVWDQRMMLNNDDRKKFLRKVRVMVNPPASKKLAERIFREVAALVNDRGAMQSRLSPEVTAARRLYKEEFGQSLDDA
ncbi:hypothetical protein ETAA8_23300 [Anatilimnocola aggregata]|uniref:Uncharacterized protein n=1 Tax=Anatilimnocola aggregata TaxID=2528021 RepID=A0A517YAI2_9BACT|nr:hypothetical protein [Anatilimnocola aggregata]QDU27243.1 hypothetical protein ETAA8_23300 [Anatilimnocola aggregata]